MFPSLSFSFFLFLENLNTTFLLTFCLYDNYLTMIFDIKTVWPRIFHGKLKKNLDIFVRNFVKNTFEFHLYNQSLIRLKRV